MLAICQLMFGLAVGTVFIHLVAFMRTVDYTEELAALAVGLALGIGAFGKPIFGALADRIGGKNALSMSFVLNATAVAILLSSPRHGIPMLGTLLVGFSGAVPVALVPTVLAETLGLKRFGTLFGWLVLIVTIGLFFGPLIGGRLFDLTGSYAMPFKLVIAINLVAAAASFACAVPAAMLATRQNVASAAHGAV
jgi:MFS family permease